MSLTATRSWNRSTFFQSLSRWPAVRWVALVAVVVLAVTLWESWSPQRAAAAPRPAAEAPAALQAPAQPLERADEASARITARVAGKRVEVTSLRSQTTQVFAEPTGEMSMSTYARPVRVRRPNGSWAPVDLTLELTGDGRLGPKAATAEVRFSSGGSGPFATVASGGKSVGLSWRTPLPAPTVDGPTATYVDVLPGVDLKVTADVEGFSKVLVVKTRAAGLSAALARLLLPIAGTGVTVGLDAGKNLRATDPAGNVVFAGSAPLMWDSSTLSDADGGSDEPGRTAPVGASLAGGELALVPDAAMLTSPTTQYPVYIDPSTRLNTVAWTYFDSGNPTVSHYNSASAAQVGTANSGTNKYRSAFSLPVGTLSGKQIVDAKFNAFLGDSWSCTASTVDLYRIAPFSSSSTWNTMPTFYSPKINAWTGAAGASPSCPAETVRFGVTPTVQAAADNGDTHLWLALRANSETTNVGWKKFSNNPNLDVTYNTTPTVPTSLATTPSTGACVTGSGRPMVNERTPSFSAAVADPDGGQVRGEFEWWTGGTLHSQQTSSYVSSGARTEEETVLPPPSFVNGATVAWRARTNDGSRSSPWSPFCEFTVDTTAPQAPTITSPDYPGGQWVTPPSTGPEPGTFTFDQLFDDDTASYLYGLDTPTPSTSVTAAADGSASVVITLAAGAHTLYARAKDRAGNLGPITSYSVLVGQGAVVEPEYGAVSAARLPLVAKSRPDHTGVTFIWRRGGTVVWTTIPAGDVHPADNPTGSVTWPYTNLTTGPDGTKTSARLTWDVASTLSAHNSGGGPLDGPLETMAVFSGGSQGQSEAVPVRFDRRMSDAETAELGPGSVNLLTGNLAVSKSDASLGAYGSDLTMSRTYNTRDHGSGPNGPLGPGWVLAGGVNELETVYTSLNSTGSLVQVTTADSRIIAFTKETNNPDGGATFAAQVGHEDLTLVYASGGDSYSLTSLDATVTTFTKAVGASSYTPSTVTNPSTGTTGWTWERKSFGTGATAQEVIRPVRLVAPAPNGVSCSTSPLITRGCRSLTFTYTPESAAPPASAQFGSYPDRLAEVAVTVWDPDLATPGMRTIVLARYDYDSTGRLHSAWDPRLDHGNGLHVATDTYAYNSDGILSVITPPAEEPWSFTYGTTTGDSGKGRIKTVARSALSAGTATSTVSYNVPLHGAGAPYDLSAAQTARWGQSEPPVTATAVFGPAQVPSDPPTSYERASITYLDFNGQEVNEAAPGGRITTTVYNKYGSDIRFLSAANRIRALDSSSTDTVEQEAGLAALYDTQNAYEDSTKEISERQRLVTTVGPEHDVTLPSGVRTRARTRTSNSYDQGAPASGGPYDLVTTTATGARVTGQTTDVDTRTTTTTYDWALRRATSTTVDPGGLALVSSTTYNGAGLAISASTPAGAGSATSPSNRSTIYWTAGANSALAECGDRPEWANLVCVVKPTAQAASGPELPLMKVEKYDVFNRASRTIQKTAAGTVLRTTVVELDGAGRPAKKTVTAVGVSVPTIRTVYDAFTARAVKTQSLNNEGVSTAELVRSYDSLGRLSSYTDADGATSTTEYDVLSRPIVVGDGIGTRTLSYDTGTERRGLPTRVNDSQTGIFEATYDADGVVVSQVLPNGVQVRTMVDETGLPTELAYSQPCSTDSSGRCAVFSESVVRTIHGQWASRGGNQSAQSYSYDKAGRLTRVIDTSNNTCTSRDYAFSGTAGRASNRTGLATYTTPASATAPCTAPAPTAPPTSTRTWTYDGADRISSSGYNYDSLGRTTSIPADDTTSPHDGSLAVSYHGNDLVQSISQGGRTNSYTLDVNQDRIRAWTDAFTSSTGTVAATRRNHYDSDSDNPSWTDESGGKTTRVVSGVSGGVAALVETNGATTTVSFQHVDLHGDIVQVYGADLATQPGPLVSNRYTEYGLAASSTDTSSRTGKTRYGWLGGHQRAQDAPAGITLMGVRLYNPATGRFFSVDPVVGGSCNSYDYACADPINKFDIDGRCILPCTGYWQKRKKSRYRIGQEAENIAEKILRQRYGYFVFKGTVFQTPMGKRRPDFLVVTQSGTVLLFEIKANRSWYGGRQKSKDEYLRRTRGWVTYVWRFTIEKHYYVWITFTGKPPPNSNA